MDTAREQPEGRAQRDKRGRFTEGNEGGPGNPFARQVAELRKAALEAVSPDDIREIMEAEDERGMLKEAYQQETEAAAKIAQLDRGDELLLRQLHLIELKIAGLEQMRTTLLAKIELHKQTRKILLNQK